MPSTIAHTTSASWIAITVVHVQPSESSYILAALVCACILDGDHLVRVIGDSRKLRRPGDEHNLKGERSALHGLLGLLVVGVLSTLLFFVDQKLACVAFIAYAIHVAQDWMIGKSNPLSPVDKAQVQLLWLPPKQKMIVDMLIVISFGALWILYLTGLIYLRRTGRCFPFLKRGWFCQISARPITAL
ncbi:MAG: metal-dependent hydrolase [Anaerolineales bacterium]|nr:MAG: metal-dependent hydrolase [Anaerolineales bacterium]